MAESMFEKMADSLANVMAKQSEVDSLLKVLQRDFQAITGIGVAPVTAKVKRAKGAAKKDPDAPKRKYNIDPEKAKARAEKIAASRAAKKAAEAAQAEE